MTDTRTPEQRHRIMQQVKSKNTSPELIVRRKLHAIGYRYRINLKSLPGKPDIVFTKKRKVIFIHGCFWHQHKNCKHGNLPKSNLDYWLPKFKDTKKRDHKNILSLKKMGYDVLVVWECELSTSKIGTTMGRIIRFLNC